MAPNRLRLPPIACMQVRGAWLPEAKYDPHGLAVVLEEQSVQARARVPLHHSPGESHTDSHLGLHLIASHCISDCVVTCPDFRHGPEFRHLPLSSRSTKRCAPPEGDALIASDEL